MQKLFTEIHYHTREGKPYIFSYRNTEFTAIFCPKKNRLSLQAIFDAPVKKELPLYRKIFPLNNFSYLVFDGRKLCYTYNLPNIEKYIQFKKLFSTFLDELSSLSH